MIECERCGTGGPVHAHHPTGRVAGVPLHPALVEQLCPACHAGLHRVWGRCGLAAHPTPALVGRRLALYLARRARPLDPESCHVLGAALDNLLDDLAGGRP